MDSFTSASCVGMVEKSLLSDFGRKGSLGMELEILSIKNKARIKVMALYLYHTSFKSYFCYLGRAAAVCC